MELQLSSDYAPFARLKHTACSTTLHVAPGEWAHDLMCCASCANAQYVISDESSVVLGTEAAAGLPASRPAWPTSEACKSAILHARRECSGAYESELHAVFVRFQATLAAPICGRDAQLRSRWL